MRARTLRPEMGDEAIPAGTVIKHQDAYVLVELGKAKPADQECFDKVLSRGRLVMPSYLMENVDLLPDEVEEEPAPSPPQVVDVSQTFREAAEIESTTPITVGAVHDEWTIGE